MDTDPSIDAVLYALANQQRRLVLRELAHVPDTEVTVDALEATVAHGLEEPPAEIRSPTEIAIQLRHVHLPALDEAGLCRYDVEQERIEYCSNVLAESLLDFLEERGRSEQVH